MKKSLRKIVFRLIDPILRILIRRSDYLREKEKKRKKEKILASFQSIGNGVFLESIFSDFHLPKNIILGNNIHIGRDVFFDGGGGIVIGDNTHISSGVTILTRRRNYQGKQLPFDVNDLYGTVSIGKNVTIEENVTILSNVKIGDGAILKTGAIVSRSINPLEIFKGSDGEHALYRDKSHYEELIKDMKIRGNRESPSLIKRNFKYASTYEQFNEKDIVFVLSTGRSGSTTFSNTFNQHPSCIAFHEDIRQLIRISTLLAYHPNRREELLEELNAIFSVKSYPCEGKKLVIHSDQRLWNLIPYLAAYFPNSKFVHLKRAPVDCIKSMISRGWYSKNEFPETHTHQWAEFRLSGASLGTHSKDEWDTMDALQKCTWYWFYLNNSISCKLKKLPSERSISVPLESFTNSLEELSSFFGIRREPLNVARSNRRKKVHNERFVMLDNDATADSIRKEINRLKERYSDC